MRGSDASVEKKPKSAIMPCPKCGRKRRFRLNEEGDLVCKVCGSVHVGGAYDRKNTVKRATGRSSRCVKR
jgi:ribosomal protein L37AE/L43A